MKIKRIETRMRLQMKLKLYR